MAKVVLGNSMTLTPGTLTLDIEDDRFLIHALTRETAQVLIDGPMPRKVARLFVNETGEMMTSIQMETEQ
ncbi:MAG: Na+/H+ antiporter subunit E, partial [Bacteriovoracaceae bacterium]